MRVSTVVALCVAGLLGSGCKTTYVYVDAAVPPQEDAGAPIGRACPWGDECYNDTVCVEIECTLTCTSSADCQDGYDCRPYKDDVYACHKSATQGASCAVDPNACSPGLFCRSRVPDDPDAYCTRECQDDRDCGLKLYCEKVPTADNLERRVCVKRGFCAPCTTDAECDVVGGVCATDSRGGRFCSKPCTPGTDQASVNTCPQPFAECKDSGGGKYLCQHRYGACVGDGELCAPCRTSDDCNADSFCYANGYSRERYCTGACDSGGGCPTGGYDCFDFGNTCESDLGCFAEGAHCNAGTCSPANPPQCLIYPMDDPNDPYSGPTNAKYPTCYPTEAGPPK